MKRTMVKPSRYKMRAYEEELLAIVQATIEGARAYAGISRAELADRMGKKKSYISKMMRGDHNMTIRTFARALAACEKRVSFEIYTPATRISKEPKR